MANYGFTRIVVQGPEHARAELRDELAASARGSLEFTLAAVAPDVWIRDDHMQEATMESAADAIVLRVCLPHDQDALRICGSLARRYPSLTFGGHFECEGTWPDFTVISHSNGVQDYRADFVVRFVAHLDGRVPGEPGHPAFLYPRSPERDVAALAFGPGSLRAFLARSPVAGSWRRSDDGPEEVCYLREQGNGTFTALVLDLAAGNGHVLSNMDIHGGFGVCETLAFRELRVRFPELSGELARTPEAARADRTLESTAFSGSPAGAYDVPF